MQLAAEPRIVPDPRLLKSAGGIKLVSIYASTILVMIFPSGRNFCVKLD